MNDAKPVVSYRRVMVGRGGTHSGRVSQRASGAKLGSAARTKALALLGLLAVVTLALSAWSDVAQGRSAVADRRTHAVSVRPGVDDIGQVARRPYAFRAPARVSAPVVPSSRSRLFAWPAPGTSTYQRAARMARVGDPEARMFVGGESDINPFDAW